MPAQHQTKIDKAVIERAKEVAKLRGISLFDYVSNTLEECVNRDLADLGEGPPGGDEGGGKPGKPKPPKPGKSPGQPERTGPVARLEDPNLVPVPGKSRRRGDGPKRHDGGAGKG